MSIGRNCAHCTMIRPRWWSHTSPSLQARHIPRISFGMAPPSFIRMDHMQSLFQYSGTSGTETKRKDYGIALFFKRVKRGGGEAEGIRLCSKGRFAPVGNISPVAGLAELRNPACGLSFSHGVSSGRSREFRQPSSYSRSRWPGLF